MGPHDHRAVVATAGLTTPSASQAPVEHAQQDENSKQAGQALADLTERIVGCRACPRLVRWREDVARDKRRSFADEPYWGRPVPGWGSGQPRILIVGLAPAAHGGNRTGRVFTGDRSGDWLFASLHRVGLARLPTSTRIGDGQQLFDTRMLAAVRCAPPQNKPTTTERDACASWLDAELALVAGTVVVVVALGAFAWQSVLGAYARAGVVIERPRPRFGHGAQAALGAVTLVGSYHPSQQNTFTGRLTEPMLDSVLATARSLSTRDDL
jgi:uracil-DNA glycosylase